MIVFAGGDGFSWLNDMFEFNLDLMEWKEIQTKGFPPSKRAGHSAVQYKDSMIIFGGWNGNNTLNDCHEFDFGNFFNFF
jgi:N-acetylneuraminic acid mutarotase